MPLQQSRLKSLTRNSAFKVPSDPIQRAWIALGRVSQAVQCHVENELKKSDFPELSWYTVLWELERAGKPTRPKDLAIPLFILPYQLSRLVDRMEAEGLVKRIICKEDKRGHLLEPTPKGSAMRKQMWTVYAPAMDAAMQRIESTARSATGFSSTRRRCGCR